MIDKSGKVATLGCIYYIILVDTEQIGRTNTLQLIKSIFVFYLEAQIREQHFSFYAVLT